MGKRARRAAKRAAVPARSEVSPGAAASRTRPLGAAGRSAGRRERGAVKRAIRLSVAISEDEAVELRARATALGVSVSRLLVESTLENARLATAPKTPAATVADAAARWQGGRSSVERFAIGYARAEGRTGDLTRLIDEAVKDELHDRDGNRPPWIVSVLPDEQAAIRAGERTAKAWEWLAHRIARLRIERDVEDARDHGLREDTDRAIWRGIEQLAHAIAVPGRLHSIKFAGEGNRRQSHTPDTTSAVEGDDGQFAPDL
jgi:hypothetical protein